MARYLILTIQERNIETLCDSVPSLALQQYPSLHTQAQQIKTKFRKAFVLFSVCHNLYDKNYLNDNDTEVLGKTEELMYTYKT